MIIEDQNHSKICTVQLQMHYTTDVLQMLLVKQKVSELVDLTDLVMRD